VIQSGYGKFLCEEGFEVSPNTVLVQAVYKAYKDEPSKHGLSKILD
jgi:cell division protein FtsI (penicillin-binding protein 3)